MEALINFVQEPNLQLQYVANKLAIPIESALICSDKYSNQPVRINERDTDEKKTFCF